MSFGFSVGDFISAISLIKDVISSLRTASVSEYRELIIELHGLQRALDEIEHLPRSPEQEPAVNSIKVAALMCQYPLDEFAGKLKKFESLDFGQTQGRAKLWNKKLKWGFTMEEEVRNLRAYLVAHVGSLNMRLLTQGLYRYRTQRRTVSFAKRSNRINTSVATARANQFQASVTQGLESSHTAIDSVHTFVRSSAEVTRNNTVILQKLANIVTRRVSMIQAA